MFDYPKSRVCSNSNSKLQSHILRHLIGASSENSQH